MKPAHASDGSFCPLWRKPRNKVCHTCAWYIQVIGKNPQTGQDLSEWNCSIAFMPMMQIETTKAGRETTATVDSLRDEVQKSNDVGMANALMGINQQIRAIAATADPQAQIATTMAAPKLLEN